MLSSVYYKPPENFVKKIRDRINERFDLETDLNEVSQPIGDLIYSEGAKKND